MEGKLTLAIVLLLSLQAPNEAAVTIEVFPKESIVKVGDTVTVMCRAGEKLQYCRVASPAGTFNLKPNIPVSNGYIYSGKGLESGECGFTIANVQEMNNGNHTCYLGFDNTGLESNTTMSVIVARPPTTSPELSVSLVGSRVSADFQEGQTIQAMCRVPDNRPPSNLTWFIGNEQVTDGLSPIRKEPENCGYADLCAVSQNLTHTLSWRDNGKELSCFVQHFAMDERANNQTKSQLNVLYKPRDVEISSEQFGFEIGKPGRISKQVQANPRPSFAWNVGGGEWIREGQVDSLTGRFRAGETINNGSGIWQASLEIDSVTAEDVERVYNLRASNIAGVTDYAVSISTMDAPQGIQLGAGEIVGICAAILALLLIIFLIIFARATGRWCFSGTATNHDTKESTAFIASGIQADPYKSSATNESDTESADHGSDQTSKPKMNLAYIFNKKDKIADDSEGLKDITTGRGTPLTIQAKQGDVVYAELDLQQGNQPRSVVRKEDDKTEYAEIIHTKTPGEESK